MFTLGALLNSLGQTFSIIFLGHLAQRFGFLASSTAAEVGKFVARVALPALIFKAFVDLDWSTINWHFFFGVFLCKAVIFFIVMLGTLSLDTTSKRLARAGLWSIFATQSNDLALGLPLIQSLYGEQFANYLYLLAPISLTILNPIGFFLMELHMHNRAENTKQAPSGSSKKVQLLLRALQNLASNPIVICAALGLAYNLFVPVKIPEVVNMTFSSISAAYAAPALFCLGMQSTGSMSGLRGSNAMSAALLVAIKIIVMPLVLKATVYILGGSDPVSDFAFVYGALPTAPTVFVFAMQYGVDADLIATSTLIGLLVSCPFILVSSLMTMLDHKQALKFIPSLNSASQVFGSVSIGMAFWVVIMFILFPDLRNSRRRVILPMALMQVIFPIAYLVCDSCDTGHGAFPWASYFISVSVTRLWLIPVSFEVGRWPSRADEMDTPMINLKKWLAFCLIVPIGVCAIGMPFWTADPHQYFPCWFRFGNSQRMVEVFMYSSVLLSVLYFLVWHDKRKNKSSRGEYSNMSSSTRSISISHADDSGSALLKKDLDMLQCTEVPVDMIRVSTLLAFGIGGVLIHLLTITLCLLNDELASSHLEMTVLDVAFTFGQGITTFSLFGLGNRTLALLTNLLFSSRSRWRSITRSWIPPRHSSLALGDPKMTPPDVSQAIVKARHSSSKLVKDRWYLFRYYQNCTVGCEMVDWMVANGIAKSRLQGVALGRAMVHYGLLMHVSEDHNFEDAYLFYQFIDESVDDLNDIEDLEVTNRPVSSPMHDI